MPRNLNLHLVMPGIRAGSRKKIFEIFAIEAAPLTRVPPRDLYEALLEKEGMATSGIGNGIAIPHIRLPHIQSRLVALMTLDQPVDFDAPDGQPADLVCVLASPERDGPLHLSELSRISRLLNNAALTRKIRATQDQDFIREMLLNPDGWLEAA